MIMQTRSRNFSRSTSVLGSASVLALSLAVLVGCSGQAAENDAPPPQVSVAPVPVRTVSQWDEFSGRIEAIEHVELRPRVSGYIERVNFTEGQEVKKGDVLFTIDARSYRAELARAQAELARARTLAELGRSEASRAKRLADLQALSTEEYEQRRANADQAQANVAAAQAAVESARLNLEWTQVRAPINGRAGRALVTAGNLVSAGDAASVLTTVVSLDKVHVHFDADERTFLRYAEMARKGERPSERDGEVPVQVALADESDFPHAGVVDFLDNQVDRSTGTIRARAVLDNKDRLFTPGLYARVRLLGSGQFQAALVDDKAVLTDQDRKYVYVVDAEGKAQRRDVQVGRMADGLRVVEKGLAAGDRVIVSGVQRVFMPGMPVTPTLVAMDQKAFVPGAADKPELAMTEVSTTPASADASN
ncbi:Multidrug resistance protein MdtE [Pseudomonas carbonaria]|uniref:Multidrug resistance protein MdtE n=2 Tax=Zestomonas carbonaria TaxID=2762745 RepID=A0A7U7EJE5_9GAMM|nr:efflux RND transporter periplasmic adaptor subunit [Pseudomonas carbonaria]CAD5106128.1 Multidrug resistance protein MdtE [Pseudomonas carbonaria]